MLEFLNLERIQKNIEVCDESICSSINRDDFDITSLGKVDFNRDISFENDSMFFHQEHKKSDSSSKGAFNFSKQDIRDDFNAEKFSDLIANSCDNNIIKTENLFLETIFDISKIPNINIERNNNLVKIIITKDQKFLNKKRKFKISFPNTFFIFEKGEDKKLRELIDEFKEKKIYKKSQNHIQKSIENSDDIRKKIKCRFLKSLKKALNKKLILVGSKETFDFLPQSFVCNISKSLNKYILDKKLEEIFSINFIKEENKDNIKNKNKVNENKYLKNKKVLEYLKENEEISEKLNYNIIKDMKLYQIFEEYLISKEFEKDIEVMKRKNEDNNYIYNYIKLACNFIDFFSQ